MLTVTPMDKSKGDWEIYNRPSSTQHPQKYTETVKEGHTPYARTLRAQAIGIAKAGWTASSVLSSVLVT